MDVNHIRKGGLPCSLSADAKITEIFDFNKLIYVMIFILIYCPAIFNMIVINCVLFVINHELIRSNFQFFDTYFVCLYI